MARDEIDRLEAEYEVSHRNTENESRINELEFQLAGLIGKNNRYLLREYTDRLIARYNTDVEWYYRKLRGGSTRRRG